MHIRIPRLKGLFLLAALAFGLLPLGDSYAVSPTRGEAGAVQISNGSGGSMSLYGGSYALLIGVSKYSHWPLLESVPMELNQLAQTLAGHGFKVRQVLDPDGNQLEEAFEDFIERYGYQKENRLVFFYSGHGYSPEQGDKGYLVPSDAPNPSVDWLGFRRKALPMTQILAWARDMEAKHSLFLFDSCFSGTVFKAKSRPTPRHIGAKTAQPVRQFITAGSANQEVPARSVFTPALIRALQGEADRSPADGYVSGSELGEYLLEKVSYYNPAQTPQYGKIRDPELDLGDFVFALANPGDQAPLQPTPAAAPAANPEPEDPAERLLQQADALLEAGNLTTPSGASAMDKYKQVLIINPLNQRARDGLKRIVGEYAAWARRRIKAGDYDKAEEFLKRAESVREGDELVMTLRDELKRKKDQEALKQRQAELKSPDPGKPDKGSPQAELKDVIMRMAGQEFERAMEAQRKKKEKEESQTRARHMSREEKDELIQVLTANDMTREDQKEFMAMLEAEGLTRRDKAELLAALERDRAQKISKIRTETGKKTPAQLSRRVTRGMVNSIGMEFIMIPAGGFLMGSTAAQLRLLRSQHAVATGNRWKEVWDDTLKREQPAHRVRIKESFYIQATEVTNAQFQRFVAETGYRTQAEKSGGRVWDGNTGQSNNAAGFNWRQPEGPGSGIQDKLDHPAVFISWNDAQAFCQWLSRKEGRNYSLPTEEQWEYACRGGKTDQVWPWGDQMSPEMKVANLSDAAWARRFPRWISFKKYDDGFVGTSPAASFSGNGYGLFDMVGNVREWCQDPYKDNYHGSLRSAHSASVRQNKKTCTTRRRLEQQSKAPAFGIQKLGRVQLLRR